MNVIVLVRVIRRNISIFLSVTLSKRNYIELIHYTVQPQLIGQKKKKRNLIRKKKETKKEDTNMNNIKKVIIEKK